MAAPGRESYLAALDRLRSATSGDTPDVVDVIGEDLLAVASMLAGQPALRRALIDPSRPVERRVGLLDGLLRGRVHDQTREVLAAVLAGRWVSGAELLNAIERLGVDGLLFAAGRAGKLADVEDNLFRFVHVIDNSPELAAVLGDITVPAGKRAELVRDLLDDKVDRYTVRLAEVAVTGFGGRSFIAALNRLVELAAERRERQVAYVTVAAPLTDSEEERLSSHLAEIYGRPVSLKVTVDSNVMGGVRVQVGSDLYDGTVRRRLDQARAALAGR